MLTPSIPQSVRPFGTSVHGTLARQSDGEAEAVGSDEGIKLGLSDSDGEVLHTIPVNVDGTTLGIDVGTDLGSLDGSFDGSNYGKLEGLFLGDSLGSTGGKVIGSDEFTKLGLSDGGFFLNN